MQFDTTANPPFIYLFFLMQPRFTKFICKNMTQNEWRAATPSPSGGLHIDAGLRYFCLGLIFLTWSYVHILYCLTLQSFTNTLLWWRPGKRKWAYSANKKYQQSNDTPACKTLPISAFLYLKFQILDSKLGVSVLIFLFIVTILLHLLNSFCTAVGYSVFSTELKTMFFLFYTSELKKPVFQQV